MKTSSEKSNIKPKKTFASRKSAKVKKVTSVNTGPTEEEIREKAEEIFHARIARGESGTAEDDWLEAEELLRGLMK